MIENNTGPSKLETKVDDKGGPVRAIHNVWNKIFHSKEECRYYWDGMCISQLWERSQLTQKQDYPSDSDECSEICSWFEKGVTRKEVQHLRRLRKRNLKYPRKKLVRRPL